MKTVFLYIIQVVLASGILYAYYHFFLRNKKFHQYNRFYLLAATIISLVVPFLDIDIYFSSREDIPLVYQMLADVRVGNAPKPGTALSFFSWEIIIRFFYWLVALLLFTRFTTALVRVWDLYRHHAAEKLGNISFINTREKGTPFSFFRWLFWNEEIHIESPAGQKIFRHELFHIREKHSWDIIYLEILTTICWINPFFHLIKKETRAIHEFLADQFAAGTENKWEYAELLVMQALQTRQRLVNPFFHNQIKRRIAMITHSSTPKNQYLRKIMVLPVTFFIVTLVAINCTSKDVNEKEPVVQEQPTGILKEKISDLESKDLNLVTDSAVFKTLKDKKARLVSGDSSEVVEISAKEFVGDLKYQLILDADNKVFEKVEIEPSFRGGQNEWRKFLEKNLKANVPFDEGAPKGTYTVMMQFIVDKKGNISDLKPLTHFGYGMEEEVTRVMKLSPAWLPAIQNGKAVRAYRKQPITFAIVRE